MGSLCVKTETLSAFHQIVLTAEFRKVSMIQILKTFMYISNAFSIYGSIYSLELIIHLIKEA